ncbi:rhamnulokinase family protein [Salinicoccus hispanicus]|uniref:Rhamnulokinase n=1 Tax=Salinicoccus hispanicus TaxID=157225 RepID=A0A6N8TZV4_9STAP|nr:rhamnulokinase family protein [Salinicoccus hispanicus]MXQ51012.1 rhamnulokinase [Salinicoccus hispanicus]
MLKKVLSFDFGASGGRAIISTYDGRTLQLDEVHRFENVPIICDDTLCWNIEQLFGEIKKVLMNIGSHTKIESIGIDTWGVDFALLDKEGKLIQNPAHYRDSRTEGMLNEVEKYLSQQELYEMTGNQIIYFNTIFQLMYLKKYKEENLNQAESLLLMPDLLNYLLTGVKCTEKTIASTTQLFDPYRKDWNSYIIDRLDLPRGIFQKVVDSGEIIGRISETLANEVGVPQLPVVATTSHDTASAVGSVPAEESSFLFISCGTWSLIGTELDEPIISSKSAHYNITNESGYNDTTHFLKNVTGLWILQETVKQFEKEGRHYSYDEVTDLIRQSGSFTCFIDTDAADFQPPGDMPSRIRNYASKTNQKVPQTDGEIFRTIYESLALKYRHVFEEIMDSTDREFKNAYIVGGGSQAEILCQMVADASGLEVIAGPVEATVIGNSAVQLISLGVIKDVTEARQIVRTSFDLKKYQGRNFPDWEKQYTNYSRILQSKVKGGV